MCEAAQTYYADRDGCIACPDGLVTSSSTFSFALAMLSIALVLFIAAAAFRSRRVKLGHGAAVRLVRRVVLSIVDVGLVPKLKMACSFYQVVVVIPKVYGVRVPDWYTQWMSNIDFIELDWFQIFPGTCFFDGFTSMLLARALVPLAAIAAVLVAAPPLALVRARCFGGSRTQLLLAGMPLGLALSFAFVPSVSAYIFSAWNCVAYKADAATGADRLYLRADPSVACGTDEHAGMKRVASVFVAVWPVGTLLLYGGLYVVCRRSVQMRRPTLARACSFLFREYQPEVCGWEVAELGKRLLLTGFVLLIDDSKSFMRLILAKLTSVGFLVLLLVFQPYRRKDHDLIAVSSQLILTVIFLAASYIKLFESADTAEIMGFDSAEQIVGMMLAFNLSMLLLVAIVMAQQFLIARRLPTMRLQNTGLVPDLAQDSARWHVFLSHIWGSGQDQVAVMKRQLQLLLPGISRLPRRRRPRGDRRARDLRADGRDDALPVQGLLPLGQLPA